MPGLSQSVMEVIQIARNVTGRTDADDPQFTNDKMFGYLLDFLQIEHPTEVRQFFQRTWWEFNIDTTTADPLPVILASTTGSTPTNLSGTKCFSTIGPPAYVDGFELFWYQDPGQFYRIWPETQTYQPTRPTYLLYYNNELTFRGPPDREYLVKIAAYEIPQPNWTVPQSFTLSSSLDNPFTARYLAYGMALDIFSDYGEMDRWNEIMPQYRRYKGQVLARTWDQMNNQRATPLF